jgi:Xaa-Pro aminopeptidase
MTEQTLKVPLLITTPTNIRYLTGFVGVEGREAYVLLDKDKTYFFTNALYAEQTKQLSPIILTKENPISAALNNVIPGSTRNPSSFSKTVSQPVGRDDKKAKLAFEEQNLTVAEYNDLKKYFDLVPTKNIIEQQRMIKKPEELANIEMAAKITDQCFSYILKRIRPGITEARLAWEIESFLKVRAGGNAFSPIVAFNQNSSQPHYAGHANNPLRKNSLILLDFGARVNGYCADMTRVVFLGTPKPEWTNTYTTVLLSQQAAIDTFSHISIYEKNIKRSGAKADKVAREVVEKAGLPTYPHSLGHGVGLDIHEAPRLTITKEADLQPNMVVTVEPGVYLEGQYGIRIEDLILLTNKGVKLLSKSPKDITVL